MPGPLLFVKSLGRIGQASADLSFRNFTAIHLNCQEKYVLCLAPVNKKKGLATSLQVLYLAPATCKDTPITKDLIVETVEKTKTCLSELSESTYEGKKTKFSSELLKKFNNSIQNNETSPGQSAKTVSVSCETTPNQDYNAITNFDKDETRITFNIKNILQDRESIPESDTKSAPKSSAEPIAKVPGEIDPVFLKKILSHEIFHLLDFHHGEISQREVAYPCAEYCFPKPSVEKNTDLMRIFKNACILDFSTEHFKTSLSGQIAAIVDLGTQRIGSPDVELLSIKKAIQFVNEEKKGTEDKKNKLKAHYFSFLVHSSAVPERIRVYLRGLYQADPKDSADPILKNYPNSPQNTANELKYIATIATAKSIKLPRKEVNKAYKVLDEEIGKIAKSSANLIRDYFFLDESVTELCPKFKTFFDDPSTIAFLKSIDSEILSNSADLEDPLLKQAAFIRRFLDEFNETTYCRVYNRRMTPTHLPKN